MTHEKTTHALGFVTYCLSDSVATIGLNRPDRLNAISPALARDLLEGLNRATQEGARVIVLKGEGRAFCAGHDLKEPDPEPGSPESEAHLENLQEITRRLVAPRVTSVAAIHGHVLGAGAELALACDIIIAAHSAEIVFPEVSVGLSVTGGGSYLLPAAVGLTRAKQLMMLGEPLDSERALNWGLVTQVVDEHSLASATETIVQQILALPAPALELSKATLNAASNLGLEKTMALEVENARHTLTSEELRQARSSYWGARD